MKAYDPYLKTVVAILLLTGAATGQEPSGSGQAGVDYVPGEIIILLRSTSESQVRLERSPTNGVQMGLVSLDLLNVRKEVTRIGESAARHVSALAARRYVLSVPEGQELTLVRAYSSNEHVELASLNHIYETVLTPDDDHWSEQWNFDDDHLQAEAAWDIHTGSSNVLVGVIDTGLDYDHPDLSPNMWSGRGRDYCGPVVLRMGRWECGHPSGTFDNDPQHVGGLSYSHGTKVAGVIAARSNNNDQFDLDDDSFIAGLAGGWNTQPGVQLMGLRAGFDNPSGSGGPVFSARAADAINWAMGTTTTEPIVFNMSWVGPRRNATLQSAIATEWSTGRAVFVGAARGANISAIGYPAGYPNVIGVTGVTQDDVKGTAAGYGSYVDVAAPVEDVPTVRYDASTGQHEYHLTGGTTPSISAAQVSGLAALVWSQYPALTNEGVVHQIVSTTDDISAVRGNVGQPWSGQIGRGRINAYRALTEWSGPLLVQANETLTWSGMIIVTGDVTIPSGVTLTVAPGTEVHFVANSDDTNSGNDGTLSELIVADGGVLEAEAGTAEADHITFRSANDTPLQNEWYGIRVESGGSATLTDVTVRDGMHCAKAEAGGSLTLTDETLSNLSNCGTPPEISGEPEEPEFPEHSDSEAVVATYTANDDEEDAVRWSLDGDDASAFTIDSDDGELRFRPVSDFEALLDAGRVLEADGTIAYAVTVQAEDSQRATATLPVTVRVLNVEEEGTVTVEPTMPRADGSLSPPRVDEELTAALQDLDRVMTGTEHWTWQRQAPGETMVEITDADAADATYTPVDGDIGYLLQATVSYDDGQGTGKSAVSEPTAAVVGAPAAPEVKATAADARVVLTWQAAPANGLPVQHDETQYSSDGIPWSGFTEVDGKDTARETTVGGLTNDIEYTFEVRAVNEAGDGEAASTSATPHFVINESEATSVSFAEIPEGTQEWNPLVATYTTNKAEDTPVTWSLGGTDKSAFVITETDGAGTLSFSAAPDYENPTDADTDTVYAVTVRAQVRAGHPDGLDGLCRGGGESDQ